MTGIETQDAINLYTSKVHIYKNVTHSPPANTITTLLNNMKAAWKPRTRSEATLKLMMTPVCPRLLNMINDFIAIWARGPRGFKRNRSYIIINVTYRRNTTHTEYLANVVVDREEHASRPGRERLVLLHCRIKCLHNNNNFIRPPQQDNQILYRFGVSISKKKLNCACNMKFTTTVEPLLYDHPQNHIGVVV